MNGIVLLLGSFLLMTVAVIILFVIFPELLLFIPRMLVPTAFHA